MRKLNRLVATVLGAAPFAALAHPGHSAAVGVGAVHAHHVTETLLLGALFAVIALGIGLGVRQMQRNRR